MADCWFGIPFFYCVCKDIFIDDDDFDDADEVFLSFGDTVCFGHCRLSFDCVEYIWNRIRMDVGAVDCLLALLVQFFIYDVYIRVEKVGN